MSRKAENMDDDLQREINAYIDGHWEEVVADIEALVEVASTEDLDASAPNAPFGPGPREALDRALNMAKRCGLDVHDCEGYVGYADFPGKSETQIGIIGHVDVVPAGPGWHYEPYAVTREGGYLLGRGVADDKGPIVCALHAVKFWVDRGNPLPYTVRVLFGANEETNMKDVAYYREHFEDPAFLFTPDAEFPVCYGEAGICSGTLTSAPIEGGVLENIEGGVAVNAVPGVARAVLRADGPGAAASVSMGHFPLAEGIVVEESDEAVVVRAFGKPAHASTPELGENAIDILAAYLLECDVLSYGERTFLELVRKVTSRYDGSCLGVQASDEHFGDLTAVGGTISMDETRIRLTIDFRYPTTTTAERIENRVHEVATGADAFFVMEHDKEPFLMSPDSPAVQAMLSAYNGATGEDAEPFTMKGGTYARVFTTGVSFGPEKPWESKPDWVGNMHGPDEGIREDLLKQALSIYIRTIGNLMELDLG